MLIGTGKLIEERRLAAVLVAHECESEGLALRKRRLMRRIVAEARRRVWEAVQQLRFLIGA